MTIRPHVHDETALRKVFAHYPSGVAALAVHLDGAEHVLVASSFSVGISLAPPLVAFAVQRSSTTWPVLRRAKRLGVSILAAGQGDLCRQLAGKDKARRWQNVEIEHAPSGAVFIGGAALAFECSVHAEYPAGDHEMILLHVETLRDPAGPDPLVFHGSQFRTLEVVL